MSVTVSDPVVDTSTVESKPRSAALFRRHAAILVVVAAAIALRVIYVIVYPKAFYFSDSRPYIGAAIENVPYTIRPYGYSLLIKPLVHQPYIWIAVAQHVLAVLLLIVAYTFLVRRGVRTWVAALAVLPFAIDARQVTYEHYVLAETAFIVCAAGGLMLLAWRDRVGWAAAAGGGLLLGYAAVTRTVGLPVIALALVYLVIRRAGVLRLLAFLVPVAAILGGYLVWYHQVHGLYAFGQYQGRFLYARVMPIADCDRLQLTTEQRVLCMPQAPAVWAQRADQYIWNPDSPARRLYPEEESDPFLNEFALTVIKQLPGEYAGMVTEQIGWHLMPRAPLYGRGECLAQQWLPPDQPGAYCRARYFLPLTSIEEPPPEHEPVDSVGARRLHAYGEIVTTPGPLYAIGPLVAIFAALWRPRRRPWRSAADGLLFTGAGLGLIVGSVVTSMFEYRYSAPAILLIPLGLALAVTRLTARTNGEACPPTSKSPSSSPA